MMNGLARASVRFRPASFVGSFIALLLGAAIVTACGTLLQSGITAHVTPERYAHTPVVVAADPYARISFQHGDKQDTAKSALPERSRVDSSLAARIHDRSGADAVPDISFPLQPQHLSKGGPQALTGRNFAALGVATGSREPAKGRAPGAGEVVLDTGTARAAHLSPGDRISLNSPSGEGHYRVSGLAPGGSGAATAWFAENEAQELSGHPGLADAIAVQPRDGVDDEALAQQVRQAVGSRAEVLTGDARGIAEVPQLSSGKSSLMGLGGSFGGIAALTVVFVVVGTIALATGQRAREFALLRAIGATPRQIRRTIATEAMLLAPAATVLGILPGLALARWWFDQMVERGSVPGQVTLDVGALPMLAALGIGLLSALGAGHLAARRPAKLRPSQALGEAALERARPGAARILLGLVALAGGIGLAAIAARMNGTDAANTGLGVVMAFLVAVALLGPLLARTFTGLFSLPLRTGAAGAPGTLAADNTKAQASRLASAITPIVMVIAFCGTLVFMQTSVADASASNVRSAVVADHVVGTSGPGLPANTAREASRIPGVASATGVLHTGAVYRSGNTLASATALGVSGNPAHLSDVLDLGISTGSFKALGESQDSVALDAALAEKLHVTTGDRIPFRLGDGTQVRATVVATYRRGLGVGQILLPRAAVARHVTHAYDTQVLVRDAPGADHEAVARKLAGIGRHNGTVTVTDADGYAVQTGQSQQLSAWANNVMAAVLGGFAAIAAANTLVMTVLDRRREVALLRLSGTTRGQVRRMMRWEALLVGATGLLVGAGIAWTTLVPLTRGLTGAAPHVPVGAALALGAGTLTLGLAATALPARALLRSHPAEAASGRQ
ncbi:FtsX-like permease family protein [Streptomyces sp. NPDC048644]|uniref:FtsX-like permease family protein n=1 Tax=Streptomyces sp. NPDC048644 TaxID=3365582 RepID=UPI0037131150